MTIKFPLILLRIERAHTLQAKKQKARNIQKFFLAKTKIEF